MCSVYLEVTERGAVFFYSIFTLAPGMKIVMWLGNKIGLCPAEGCILWPAKDCWPEKHVLKYWLSSFRQHLGLTPLDQAACQEMPTLSRVQRSNIIQTLPSLKWMSASWHRGRATFNCPVLRLADVTTETGPPGFFRPKTFGPLAEAGLDWAACQEMPTLCRVWNANTVQTLHSLAEISASWQRGRATFNCPALRLAYVTTGTWPLGFFEPDTFWLHIKARLDWVFC